MFAPLLILHLRRDHQLLPSLILRSPQEHCAGARRRHDAATTAMKRALSRTSLSSLRAASSSPSPSPPPTPTAPKLRTLVGRIYEHHCINFLLSAPYQPVAALEAESDEGLLEKQQELHDAGLGVRQVFHSGTKSSHDQGVDARGWWDVPFRSSPSSGGGDGLEKKRIRVVVQCKVMRGDVKLVREMEGIVGWESVLARPPSEGSPTAVYEEDQASLSSASEEGTQALADQITSNPHFAHRIVPRAEPSSPSTPTSPSPSSSPSSPPSTVRHPVLGVVFSSRGFTSRALEKSRATSMPMLLISLSPPRLPTPPTATLVGSKEDRLMRKGTHLLSLLTSSTSLRSSHASSDPSPSVPPVVPFDLSLAYLNPAASHLFGSFAFRRIPTPHFSVRRRKQRRLEEEQAAARRVNDGEEHGGVLADAEGEDEEREEVVKGLESALAFEPYLDSDPATQTSSNTSPLADADPASEATGGGGGFLEDEEDDEGRGEESMETARESRQVLFFEGSRWKGWSPSG